MSRRVIVLAAVLTLLAGCATSQPAPSTPAITLDAPINHPDPEVRKYLEALRTAIRRGWKFPCVSVPTGGGCTYVDGKVVLEFGIAWDGAVAFTEVKTSSGYPELDTAATEAVRIAAPFPSPPAGLKRPGNGIPIRASMIYRVERQDPAATR